MAKRTNHVPDPLQRRPHPGNDQAAPWSLLGDVETNAATKHAGGVAQEEPEPISLEASGNLAEELLHRSWWSHRQRVLAAMVLAGEPEKTIQRARDCGKYATVQRCTTTGEHRIRGSRCRHRFCRRCSQVVSLNVADNLAEMITAAKLRCSHIVLTLKHRPGKLREIRQRLYTCFKDLRNHPTWKRHVAGGAAFCQMHTSKKDGHWHVHFHLIAEHHYIDQEELSHLWLEITGDSTNVYIERVDRIENVVREATRYVASPIDKTTARNLHHLAQAIDACRGAHLCFTFGSWRGSKLHAHRPEPEGKEWVDVIHLGDLIHNAYAGDDAAKRLLAELLGSELAATGPPTLFHQQ
jgi:Transposase zinc-binding domain